MDKDLEKCDHNYRLNIPNNQEHLEAAQIEIDEARASYVSKQSDEYIKKFKLVEEFVGKLCDNKIYFNLCINLGDSAPDGEGYWRFHKLQYENDKKDLVWHYDGVINSTLLFASNFFNKEVYGAFQKRDDNSLRAVFLYQAGKRIL